jgi:hypothetical protein
MAYLTGRSSLDKGRSELNSGRHGKGNEQHKVEGEVKLWCSGRRAQLLRAESDPHVV